jgi:hypothetical protein
MEIGASEIFVSHVYSSSTHKAKIRINLDVHWQMNGYRKCVNMLKYYSVIKNRQNPVICKHRWNWKILH